MALGLDTRYADEEDDATSVKRTEALQNGFQLWKEYDSERSEALRTDALRQLARFEDLTGISTAKHREELEKHGNDPRFIREKMDRMKKGAVNYYEKVLTESEAYYAEGTFGDNLDDEKWDEISRFEKLELSEMVDIYETLDEKLLKKRRFAERFAKQSTLVKNQFNSVLRKSTRSNLDYEDILENVLESFGDLEDYPSAVQAEFKKKAASVGEASQLKQISKEIIKEYQKLEDAYFGTLDDNEEYFGGGIIKGKDGVKRRSTNNEFRDWFMERKSLADMRSALDLLPKYVAERVKLHEKRDELLEEASPKDRARFEKITQKMGRTELEAYLEDTLEPAIREDNLIFARYKGEILTAREGDYPLYNKFETGKKLQAFNKASIKQQKALLITEEMSMKKRRRIARTYADLPSYLRNDELFEQAHLYTRESLLMKARAEQNKKLDPFDIAEDDEEGEVSDEKLTKITESLKTEKGEKLVGDVLKSQEVADYKETLKVQEKTWKRIRRNVLSAEFQDLDQKEFFNKDLSFWTRKPENLNETHETDNFRMKNKIRFHKAAGDLFDKGVVAHSSGETVKRKDISLEDLERKGGNKEVDQKLKEAQYATDIFIVDSEGRLPNYVSKVFEKAMENTMKKFLPQMMENVLKELNLSGASKSILKKSKKANDAVEERVMKEFAGLKGLDAYENRAE